MKIVRLEAKNVKRLRAVEIVPDPEGNLVVVGGKNGQGKTSVLDSIAYALCGKEAFPREPLRRGEEVGSVAVDLGDFLVRRTFRKDGASTLTIDTKEGGRLMQPQTRLDGLIGRLSFDPLEFSRMKPKEQSETLRQLLGLDFSEVEARRTAVFEQRTELNREARGIEARLQAAGPFMPNLPDAEVSAAAVLADLEKAQATVAKAEEAKRAAANAHHDRQHMANEVQGVTERTAHEVRRAEEEVRAIEEQIEELQGRLASERQHVKMLDELRAKAIEEAKRAEERAREAAKKADHSADAAAAAIVDPAPIKARLLEIESTNRHVRANLERRDLSEALVAKRGEADALTSQLASVEDVKRQAISAAQFPVEGLGFDADGGVTFSGIPFEQASAAEQLRVSAAMGLAMNPTLRVLLIRDGSLLDDESLRILAEMAEKADAQVWIERVEKDGATVVIEDGMVAAAEEVKA